MILKNHLRNAIAVCLHLLILSVNVSEASPSRETSWLMDEPLSLFDMGLYKTTILAEEELNKFKNKVNKEIGKDFIYSTDSSVEYDWDKDRIKIEWTIFYQIDTLIQSDGKPEKMDTQDKLNQFCHYALSRLEGNTFGQSDSFENYGKEQISKLFGHSGYIKDDMPKDLYREIAGKIIYGVRVQHDTFFRTKGKEKNTKLRPILCKIGFDDPLKTSSPMYIDWYKELDRQFKDEMKKEAK